MTNAALGQTFDFLDLNKDGDLTQNEFAMYIQSAEQDHKRRRQALDKETREEMQE